MHQKAQVRAALVVATMVSLLAPGRARAQESGIPVGTPAPAAMVRMMDGTPVDLATFYGDKPVVLEFWATWCPLCRSLEPGLQAARAKYAGSVRFIGVGVASNQSAERQLAYVRKRELSGEYVFDADDAARKAFAAPHTSYVVVIDRNRKVVYTGGGGEQDIDAAVRMGMR